jgi:hypothetical protein
MHRITQRLSPLRLFRSTKRTGLLLAGAVAVAMSLGTAASASAAPVYWIVNVNSGKALGPHKHSKGENYWIQQMTYFNGSGGAHHWKISTLAGDQMTFENRHSHKCISSVDHESWAPPAANGTPAIQRTCEFGAGVPQRAQAQRWRVSSVSNFWAGKPFTLRNMRNNKCLEIYDFSLAENADTAVWDCHGLANQQWRLVYAGNAG